MPDIDNAAVFRREGNDMHFLTRVQIEGFKSIKAADLELGRLNVFIGANGSGKSNLVSFFKFLNHMMTGNLQGHIATSGNASSLLHYGPKVTQQIQAVLDFRTHNANNRYSMRLAHAPAGDILVFLDETISYRKDGFQGQPYLRSLGVGHRESELTRQEQANYKSRAQNKAYKALPVFRGILGACRAFQFHDTSAQAHIRLPCEINRNQYLYSDGGNLAAMLYRFQQTRPQVLDRISDTFRLVAPFFGQFVLCPQAMNARMIELRWTERDHDYDLGPHQISDGSLRAIALITLLLQPAENLPRVMVIDEPELGLHPYAISLLAALLREASEHSQILLATESVTLLNHFQPEEVVVTERCMGETVFKRLGSEELTEWLDQYAMGELWEKNLLGGRPSR